MASSISKISLKYFELISNMFQSLIFFFEGIRVINNTIQSMRLIKWKYGENKTTYGLASTANRETNTISWTKEIKNNKGFQSVQKKISGNIEPINCNDQCNQYISQHTRYQPPELISSLNLIGRMNFILVVAYFSLFSFSLKPSRKWGSSGIDGNPSCSIEYISSQSNSNSTWATLILRASFFWRP